MQRVLKSCVLTYRAPNDEGAPVHVAVPVFLDARVPPCKHHIHRRVQAMDMTSEVGMNRKNA